MKKNFFIIGAIIIAIVLAVAWFSLKKGDDSINLEQLKQERSDLVDMINQIEKWQGKVAEKPEDVEYYSTLAMAWKSLGDLEYKKSDNWKKYYEEALKIYNKIIELTNRKNSLFLSQAGKMADYIEDYTMAEDYYKEAISVDPGNPNMYVLLAELYEYKMNKNKDEVVAVYEQGESIIINPNFLKQRKEEYLERYNTN